MRFGFSGWSGADFLSNDGIHGIGQTPCYRAGFAIANGFVVQLRGGHDVHGRACQEGFVGSTEFLDAYGLLADSNACPRGGFEREPAGYAGKKSILAFSKDYDGSERSGSGRRLARFWSVQPAPLKVWRSWQIEETGDYASRRALQRDGSKRR